MRAVIQLVLLHLVATCSAEDPAAAAQMVMDAREAAKQGNVERADALFSKAAQLDPKSGEALMYRANVQAYISGMG